MAWNDEKLQLVVSKLLISGVVLSAAVVLTGAVGFLIVHGDTAADYHSFHGVPAYLRSVPGIWRAVMTLDWRAVIQLGLLLLIATPVARVGFSLVAFAMEKDRAYVALTAGVLAILLYSLTSQQ